MLTHRQRRLALAGLVCPAIGVASWMFGGLAVRGYSSFEYPVSRLAALSSWYRWVMLSGLIVFGVGLLLYAPVLRVALPGLAWITLTATGVASIALAVYPLSNGPEPIHNISAGALYMGIAATPLFAYWPFAEAGMLSAARLSAVAGLVAAACLELTAFAPLPGLFQRLGLIAGFAWISVTTVVLYQHGTLLDRGAPSDEAPRSGNMVATVSRPS